MISHATSSPDGLICVFCKAPRPGQAKTRLARALGEETAARLAAAFVADTLASLSAHAPDRVVAAVTPDDWRPNADVATIAQGSGTLGQRLERVIAALLERVRWVLVVGTDSPGLPHERLAVAEEHLAAGRRAVLGPVDDGGFWGLGLRQAVRLAGVRWSTPHTADDTGAALARQGCQPLRLPGWYDVDRFEDLCRLDAELKAGLIEAPQTARELAAIDLERVSVGG